MSAPLLQVNNLTKRFGSFEALRGATFAVNEGEILGLIGPNGSGKTTLFQCVAAILPAEDGTVAVRGTQVSLFERQQWLFYLPDHIRPWPGQSVAWALHFIAEMSDATARDVARMSSALGIQHLANSRLSSLSKGEHKRVLLAMGMLSPQPLLLLDEPFDGLDLRQTRDAMDMLRSAARNGRTLFLSIHQLTDAMRVCDRFVLLSDGRTVGEGTLTELRTRAALGAEEHPSLEEVFLALT